MDFILLRRINLTKVPSHFADMKLVERQIKLQTNYGKTVNLKMAIQDKASILDLISWPTGRTIFVL